MSNPDRMRCPECRTRRTDPRAFLLHVMSCERPVCHCGSYTYPHRPMSGMCTLNPDAQVALAARAGTPPEQLLEVAIDVALHMRGKPMNEWPFDTGRRWMREADVEQHLVKRVKQEGGEVRKAAWIGRRHAPDRRVMLSRPGFPCWVELKRPGETPRPGQVREHERMRALGEIVHVVDSIEAVEALLA